MTMEHSAETVAGVTHSDHSAEQRAKRKERVGLVVSVKNSKTIIVESTTRVPHPRFRKIVKRIQRYHAHDEGSEAKLGDTVKIMESRRISKLKRWRLVTIVGH
jgi:small subunit ribosomal protein S17